MFEIEVTNNRASAKRGELLTKGQVGAQVQFTFNDHWTGMKKTAVFKRCGKTIDVVDSEWNGDIVTVPPEMTEEAGLPISAVAFMDFLPVTFWTCLSSGDNVKLICKMYVYDFSNETSLTWKLFTKTELPVIP